MIQCERQIPIVAGLKDQEITVGRHVFFACTGDYDKAFNRASLAPKRIQGFSSNQYTTWLAISEMPKANGSSNASDILPVRVMAAFTTLYTSG